MNNRCKIAVFDLDGTLTNSKKELSPRNKSALLRLQREGVRVVLASGRPTYGILPLAQELELNHYGGYILAFNGGVIIDCSTAKSVHSNVLPMELIAPLYEASKLYDTVILSYDGAEIITEDSTNKYVGVESHLNKMAVREVADFLEVITSPVPKCLAVGEPENVIRLEGELSQAYGEVMSIYRSEPFFLELVPLGIDKAQSLKVLLDVVGASREEMVAFGDGYNDLSMIEFAGVGVAMSNAQDVVKESADVVTLSNDEDGVAEYIEKFLLP